MGYYRGARGGRWLARYRQPGATGGYAKSTIGVADDILDADGERILTCAQAQAKARAWFDEMVSRERAPKDTLQTVGDALTDYMANFQGKSVVATKSRIEAIIRPALGAVRLDKLTAKHIADWHRERAT